MSAPPTDPQLIQLVYDEARLLDEKRYDEWLALFAEDGRYWVPMSSTQTDSRIAQSIALEDKMMLRIRIERLRSGKAYSERPPAACQHVLQLPRVLPFDSELEVYRTRTPFLYLEARGDDQTVLAGTLGHAIRLDAAGLRIIEKRVDLLNASASLPAIFLFP